MKRLAILLCALLVIAWVAGCGPINPATGDYDPYYARPYSSTYQYGRCQIRCTTIGSHTRCREYRC